MSSEENADSQSDELSLISIPSDYEPAGGIAFLQKLIEDTRAPLYLVPNDITDSTTPEGYARHLSPSEDGQVLLFDSSKVTPTNVVVDSNDTNEFGVLAGLTVATSVLNVRMERKLTLVSWSPVLFVEPLAIVVQKMVRYIHQVIEVTGNPVVAVGAMPVQHRAELQRALTHQCRLQDQLFLDRVRTNVCGAMSQPSLTQTFMKPVRDLHTMKVSQYGNGNLDCLVTSRVIQTEVRPFIPLFNSSDVVRSYLSLPIKTILSMPPRIATFIGS